jgi:hypothetical protein
MSTTTTHNVFEHPSFVPTGHESCTVCAVLTRQRAARHRLTIEAMQRVHRARAARRAAIEAAAAEAGA